MPAASPLPRAGWYHDPAGAGYRWWDGSAWTAGVIGATANAAPADPPPTPRRTPPGAPVVQAGHAPASWVAPAIAGLVAVGAALIVLGSVLPWVRASAPGARSVTRLGTDAGTGYATLAAGVLVALEAGRWLQRRRPARVGAVLALLVAVATAATAAVGFVRLGHGVATLAGATGPVTRTAGAGLPFIAAGCVAVVSGTVAGALH